MQVSRSFFVLVMHFEYAPSGFEAGIELEDAKDVKRKISAEIVRFASLMINHPLFWPS